MADEDNSIAPVLEQAAPAIEVDATAAPEAVTDEPERILDPGEVAEVEEAAQAELEEELEEFEWNGKPVKGPKGLKDGVLMQSDYTKKTQDISKKAKELESREAEINQKLEATEEELDARSTLRDVDKRIGEYAKLTQADWDYHHNIDPMGTDKAWRDFQFLKEQRTEVAKNLETKQNERTQAAQQSLAKRVEETTAFAQKEIPGWKPELTETLVKLAHDFGMPEDALKANWSPVLYKLLHRAHIGELTLNRQTAPKPTPTPIQPLATVGGKSTPAARADLASSDMESYVALRRKGVGGKALR